MARAERDALDALGLDSSRTAFALDAERLREHVEAVRAPVEALVAALAGVTSRLTEVEAHAVSAVEAANRRAADAEAERIVAEARARAEGEKVIALAAEGAFPFDGSFIDFRPPPEWPPTDLPPWWDAVTP